jgi:hypothetical protein
MAAQEEVHQARQPPLELPELSKRSANACSWRQDSQKPSKLFSTPAATLTILMPVIQS